ncbi:hypothetical protein RMATCC62417_16538 [Rhizopus microsporus]|nr:hypothetical protein RMATCC62417_16538 [Rhizopus microsporus]
MDATWQHSSTLLRPTPTAAAQQISTICNTTFNHTESPLSYRSSNETRTHLVDFATSALEWSAYPSPHTHHSSVHGCVRHGLGNSLWQSSLLWSLVLSRMLFPYQLQGTPSCGQSPTADATITLGTHPAMYGQHIYLGIYQQIWRYPLLQPGRLGNGHMELLLSELHTIVDAIRSIPLRPRRRSVSSAHASERMDLAIEGFPSVGPPVGPLPPRPIRHTQEHQDSANFYVMNIPPASSMDQRLFEELDHFLQTAVSGFSMERDTTHLAAVDPASPTGDTHHAQLAVRSVVSTGSSIGASTPSDPPSRGSGKRHRSASPQEEPQLEYASVEHLAKCLEHSFLSSSALAIISPTASSTRRQHHFRQQNYATWCYAR